LNYIWLVVNPDDLETPVGGIWSTLELAAEHCAEDYVILKLELDRDYLDTKVELVN
jgi:hypothetical protein